MNELNSSSFFVIVDDKSSDFCLVNLNGELDKAGLESVRAELDQVVESLNKKYLVFDCTDLEFINSESIGYLLTLHYRLLKKEQELVLVNVTQRVRDVLDVVGILKLIKFFDSVDNFKQSK